MAKRMKKVDAIYIGSGFVGATSAAHMAESGHEVLVYDIDEKKISDLDSRNFKRINKWINEVGLFETLHRYQQNIQFTCDKKLIQKALWKDQTPLAFLCLPTPTKEGSETGEADLTYLDRAIEMLAGFLNNKKRKHRFLIVLRSTLPLDSVHRVRGILEKHKVKNVGILVQPEFLVEGAAMRDLKKNRIIIGSDDENDTETIRRFFRRHWQRVTITGTKEALAIKLLSNSALFTKLAYCYAVAGRICEAHPDLDYETIRQGVTGDSRLGPWGFYVSLFAGGSCFIKDAYNLSHQLDKAGLDSSFLRAVLQANFDQINRLMSRVQDDLGMSIQGKKVGVLGLAFKEDTNDCRNSGSLHILKGLLEQGVKEIVAHDPFLITKNHLLQQQRDMFGPQEANRLGKSLSSKVLRVTQDVDEAIRNRDIIYICTDHQEYRALGIELCRLYKNKKIVFCDGRRILKGSYEKILALKHTAIVAVGSPTMVSPHHSITKKRPPSSPSSKGYAILWKEGKEEFYRELEPLR